MSSSTQQLTGVKRPRGRPRSERARQAILRSTLKLLQEVGFAELSIEAVATRAGVGKPTVYRWWNSKAALVADAFISGAEMALRFPHTGTPLSDIRGQMNNLVRALRSRRGRIVAALIGGGQTNPELIQAFHDRYLRPRRQEARATLQHAITNGELPPHLDLDLLLDALYGPIYMRFLVHHAPLTDAFADEIWKLVMTTLGVKSASEAHDSAGASGTVKGARVQP